MSTNRTAHAHLINSPATTSKTLLAKFMAHENLTVIRDPKAKSAYMDLKKRVLGLPVWNDMSEDLECMLIGQQAGHAIHSPVRDTQKLSQGKLPFYSQILQLVEADWIARKQKRRFPGLNKNYREGTKEMVSKGVVPSFDLKQFYDENGDPIPNTFLDRLFVYTKLAPYLGEKVEFTDEELPLVYATEEADNFDEVIEVAEQIHGYLKEKIEEEKNPPPPLPQEGDDSQESQDDDDSDSSDEEDQEKSDSPQKDKGKSENKEEGSEEEDEEEGSDDRDEKDSSEEERDNDEESEDDSSSDDGVDDEQDSEDETDSDDKDEGEGSDSDDTTDDEASDDEGDEESDSDSGGDDELDESDDTSGRDSEDDSGDDASDEDEDSSEDDAGASGDGAGWGSGLLDQYNQNLEQFIGADVPDEEGVEKKPYQPSKYQVEYDATNLSALPYVLPYQDCLLDLYPTFYHNKDAGFRDRIDQQLREFTTRTTKVVNHMAQEFMMRKSARELMKTGVSRSGQLDEDLLYKFRLSEDVFKKHDIETKGKNHGVLIFLDMSGSMETQMRDSILQLFNLIMFCRAVQIPYEVYGFTSNGPVSDHIPPGKDSLAKYRANGKAGKRISDRLTLNQYFSNRMAQHEFMIMMKGLLGYADRSSGGFYNYGGGYYGSYNKKNYTPGAIHALGGTPLNCTILASKDLFWRFKEANNLDIVHSIYITDGASDSGLLCDGNRDHITEARIKNGALTYDYSGYGQNGTNIVLDILRDETDSKVVSMYLVRDASGMRGSTEFTALPSAQQKKYIGEFTTQGYAEIPSSYDKMFLINPGLLSLDSAADVTLQLKSRPLLQSFIKTIAV